MSITAEALAEALFVDATRELLSTEVAAAVWANLAGTPAADEVTERAQRVIDNIMGGVAAECGS